MRITRNRHGLVVLESTHPCYPIEDALRHMGIMLGDIVTVAPVGEQPGTQLTTLGDAADAGTAAMLECAECMVCDRHAPA